jgi:hypothetical protein
MFLMFDVEVEVWKGWCSVKKVLRMRGHKRSRMRSLDFRAEGMGLRKVVVGNN